MKYKLGDKVLFKCEDQLYKDHIAADGMVGVISEVDTLFNDYAIIFDKVVLDANKSISLVLEYQLKYARIRNTKTARIIYPNNRISDDKRWIEL